MISCAYLWLKYEQEVCLTKFFSEGGSMFEVTEVCFSPCQQGRSKITMQRSIFCSLVELIYILKTFSPFPVCKMQKGHGTLEPLCKQTSVTHGAKC